MSTYHNPYSPNSVSPMILSMAQMRDNAEFIYDFLHSRYGWTLEAVAGMLGNIQSESTMNPARPQNNAVNNGWFPSGPYWPSFDAPTPTTTWYGYGLFQITPFAAGEGSTAYNPYTYGNWAYSHGYTMSHASGGTCGMMEPQLIWLMSGAPEHAYYNSAAPSKNQAKWYQHRSSPLQAATPAQYGALTGSPEDCARTFYWNLERSGAMDPGSRPSQARTWYEYLSGYTPTPPEPPEPPGPEPPTPGSAGNFIPWYTGVFLTGRRRK